MVENVIQVVITLALVGVILRYVYVSLRGPEE